MTSGVPPVLAQRPPGTEPPRKRFRPPKIRWEIVGCAVNGHDLVDTATAERTGHADLLVLTDDTVTWHRCLRCDGWLPLIPPHEPRPVDGDLELPLRGRPLRDRYVLRLVAIDRVLHFLLLGIIGVAIFVFADHRSELHGDYLRILNRLQGAVGGVTSDTQHHGLLHSVDELFALSTTKLYFYGAAISVFAVVNGIEAFGLWRARRWAEYLTFIEVLALLPLTIIELTERVSPVKVVGLVVDLAVAGYLLWAKRLFGMRGGGSADRAEKEHDSGWAALERVTPHLRTVQESDPVS
jgi:uncharacterized membrane protein (DUF2068 family)